MSARVLLATSTATLSEPPSLGVGETALRLFLAAAAAALIGWERESKNRPAGLRTHILVGLGSCLFTLLALDTFERRSSPSSPGIDPLRVVDGIVGGVGFLGAGAIMQSHGTIKGLTTAAGIWVVAAIGVAAALGNYRMLAITVAFAWLTLTTLARFTRARPDGDDGNDSAPPATSARADAPGSFDSSARAAGDHE